MNESLNIVEAGCPLEAKFVAINTITCNDDYVERFEELFSTRVKAIDRMQGFCGMQVLKDNKPGGAYLIVSYWHSGKDFERWTGSEEFLEGHKRGFEDLRKAKEQGLDPPMKSDFRTYQVFAR